MLRPFDNKERERSPLWASIKNLPLDREEGCQRRKRKLNVSPSKRFFLISEFWFCFLVLSCHSCIPHGRPAPLGAAEVLRVAAGQAAAVAAVVQATLHFLSWLQPSILNVCPNNSSSRSSVLISGPRNLKCSSWFCATMVFIILILNEKSSWGLVFAQEFLEEGEGCAGQQGCTHFSS